MKSTFGPLSRLFLLTLTFAMGACGSSGGDVAPVDDDPPPPAATYSIGGSVSGLTGDGVMLALSLNGTVVENLTVTADGSYAFSARALQLDSYAIAITGSPANPTQYCEFDNPDNAAGTIIGDFGVANITCRPAFLVSVEVSGLDGTGLVLLNTVNDDFAINLADYPRLDRLEIDADGSATFAMTLRSGEDYEITIETQPSNPGQECTVENGTGSITNANVSNIVVACERGTVSGTVTGLNGDTITLALDIDTEFGGARPLLDFETLNISADGEFEFDAVLDEGDWYRVDVRNPVGSTAPDCTVINPTGTMQGTVDNVRVECGDLATIGGEVVNLFGSGLELRLIEIAETNTGTVETDVEDMPIASDGPFEFATALRIGDGYRVEVATQPEIPTQECRVENDNGEIEDDVTDVRVDCGGPHRFYRFDDSTSIQEDEGLQQGDVYFGEFTEFFVFGTGPAVALGSVSGLDGSELFETFIDGPLASGVVFSNETGFTYWMAAESGSQPSHYSRLNTRWRLRKESEDAEFTLYITRVNLLAYDAGHSPSSPEPGSLRASANLAIRGVLPGATPDDDEVFFEQQGEIELLGRRSETNSLRTDWTLEPRVDSGALDELWNASNFQLNDAAGVPGRVDPERVAFAQLASPIEVNVDLSDIEVGQVFEVRAKGVAAGRNNYSNEGGSVAFLRDPGGFDPGNPEFASSVEMTDLLVLPIEEEEEYPAGPGIWPTPAVCDPADAERSRLSFGAAGFSVTENDETFPYRMITIVRDGSTEGIVEARISLVQDTALAGEDFDAGDIVVRFGDQSTAPRTLVLPVIDDVTPEDDETLTVRLHSPTGCAEIGDQGEATVTILANDPARGQIAFTADAYDVDENAGFATVTVERTNGVFSFVSARVETADGTAVASTDYVETSEFIVFADGEVGEKTVTIPILDNVNIEGNRTVLLSISPISPLEPGVPSDAVLTIQDDDAAANGSLQFTENSYSTPEGGGPLTVTVERVGGSAGQVSVTIATSDGSATAGMDYDFTQGVATFQAGDIAPKSIDIPITDDPDDEGDESFNLMLFDVTGGADIGTPDVVPVVIIDDDGAPPPLPPAPALSISAEPNRLIFDWPSIAEAASFRLLRDPDGMSGFSQVGNDIPLGETRHLLSVSVHLTDWDNARFLLQACNSSGCTNSNEVDVSTLMLSSIAFVKSSNSQGRGVSPVLDGDYFGWRTTVSGDGRTLAASSFNEDGSAVFLNGDEADNGEVNSGAVYVLVQTETGWVQQAYVKASNTRSGARFGDALALSADGDTLAVGAPLESSNATGINGDDANTFAGASGAVYVYRRSGDVWLFEAYVKASNTGAADEFGSAVALSDDGDVLVVGAPGESSDAIGLNGDQQNDLAADSGAAYVFTRSGQTWSQSDYVKASNAEPADAFGTTVAVSGNGILFAASARSEDSAATGVNGDQSDNSAPGTGSRFAGTGAVYVFGFDGSTWEQSAYVKPSNTDADDQFGSSIGLNGDGTLLAVGARREASAATGVNSPLEADNSADGAGAVYVYTRDSALWQQAAYLKASNAERSNTFGDALDISGDGRYLIVGANFENSRAVGIGGDQTQDGIVGVGAAYLFERDEQTGSWSERAYVKSSNSDQNPDFPNFGRELSFGFSTSISDDGAVLAIGAYRDASDAQGVGGDPINQDALQSGAVYVY